MGISLQQLLIVLVIVALIFGTKRLRNIGSDLGKSVRDFKDAMGREEDTKDTESPSGEPKNLGAERGTTVEGEVSQSEESGKR